MRSSRFRRENSCSITQYQSTRTNAELQTSAHTRAQSIYVGAELRFRLNNVSSTGSRYAKSRARADVNRGLIWNSLIGFSTVFLQDLTDMAFTPVSRVSLTHTIPCFPNQYKIAFDANITVLIAPKLHSAHDRSQTHFGCFRSNNGMIVFFFALMPCYRNANGTTAKKEQSK